MRKTYNSTAASTESLDSDTDFGGMVNRLLASLTWFSINCSTQSLIHFVRFMTHPSHPPIYKLSVLLLQLPRRLFRDIDL